MKDNQISCILQKLELYLTITSYSHLFTVIAILQAKCLFEKWPYI